MRRVLSARAMHRDQRGVTVVIVALSLLALFGITVLVVDVGSLLWHRREMVNAADAAALSAAKTCSVPATQDPADPAVRADEAAIANKADLTPAHRTEFLPGPTATTCTQFLRTPTGSVTVTYRAPHDLYFAPVLGAGSTNDITTTATAAWGPLAGGNAVPIVLESGQFQTSDDCNVPDVAVIGQECAFWYNNGPFAIGGASWGFINLDRWGVDRFDNNICTNGGSNTRSDYILHDYSGTLLLDDPGPTYVCRSEGASAGSWFNQLQARLDGICQSSGHGCNDSDGIPPYDDWPGPQILMPVNDCDAQVDRQGNVVPCGTGTPDKFAITGFTRLELKWILDGRDTSTTDGTPAAAQSGGSASQSGSCTRVGLNLPVTGAKDLQLLADANCGAPATVDRIPFDGPQSSSAAAPLTTTFKVFYETGSGASRVTTYYQGCTTAAPGCDYTYNPTTKYLQWVNGVSFADGRTKRISLSWQVDGVAPTPGKCGYVAPDANAICLVMIWKGYTPGPGPIGGEDFGAAGVILCDHDYSSCPAGTKPNY